MLNRIGNETAVHYLWDGFEKKLKSLNLAGVVPQRIEAFSICAFCLSGPGITTGALPDKGYCMSDVILRANRRRDIKTFSDALATD